MDLRSLALACEIRGARESVSYRSHGRYAFVRKRLPRDMPAELVAHGWLPGDVVTRMVWRWNPPKHSQSEIGTLHDAARATQRTEARP